MQSHYSFSNIILAHILIFLERTWSKRTAMFMYSIYTLIHWMFMCTKYYHRSLIVNDEQLVFQFTHCFVTLSLWSNLPLYFFIFSLVLVTLFYCFLVQSSSLYYAYIWNTHTQYQKHIRDSSGLSNVWFYQYNLTKHLHYTFLTLMQRHYY